MFAHVPHVHVFFICQMVFNTDMFSHVKYTGMSQGQPFVYSCRLSWKQHELQQRQTQNQ